MNASKRGNELLTIKIGTACFVGTVFFSELSNLKGLYPMAITSQSISNQFKVFRLTDK